ncbi:hypothetical protein H8E88_35825 [candidate division KSB1 bacterium]|nr:hypothetical protein [candidate division KSB1 bacterium]
MTKINNAEITKILIEYESILQKIRILLATKKQKEICKVAGVNHTFLSAILGSYNKVEKIMKAINKVPDWIR